MGIDVNEFGEFHHFIGICNGSKGQMMNLHVVAPNKFDALPFFSGRETIQMVVSKIVLANFAIGYYSIVCDTVYRITAYG
jgi:hypothetical protein